MLLAHHDIPISVILEHFSLSLTVDMDIAFLLLRSIMYHVVL